MAFLGIPEVVWSIFTPNDLAILQCDMLRIGYKKILLLEFSTSRRFHHSTIPPSHLDMVGDHYVHLLIENSILIENARSSDIS